MQGLTSHVAGWKEKTTCLEHLRNFQTHVFQDDFEDVFSCLIWVIDIWQINHLFKPSNTPFIENYEGPDPVIVKVRYIIPSYHPPLELHQPQNFSILIKVYLFMFPGSLYFSQSKLHVLSFLGKSPIQNHQQHFHHVWSHPPQWVELLNDHQNCTDTSPNKKAREFRMLPQDRTKLHQAFFLDIEATVWRVTLHQLPNTGTQTWDAPLWVSRWNTTKSTRYRYPPWVRETTDLGALISILSKADAMQKVSIVEGSPHSFTKRYSAASSRVFIWVLWRKSRLPAFNWEEGSIVPNPAIIYVRKLSTWEIYFATILFHPLFFSY